MQIKQYVFRSLAGLAFVCQAVAVPPPDVLTKNCAECHSEKLHTSGFSVGSLEAVVQGGNKHGRAVIAGHPETSPLIKMLNGELAPRMPMGRGAFGERNCGAGNLDPHYARLRPTGGFGGVALAL